LEANTPLPKSSARCPAEPTLSKTDKGLIAVGVVLAVMIVAAALYAGYKWLTKKRVKKDLSHSTPPQPASPSETIGRHQKVPRDPRPAVLQ
jgi:hypothetical protein